MLSKSYHSTHFSTFKGASLINFHSLRGLQSWWGITVFIILHQNFVSQGVHYPNAVQLYQEGHKDGENPSIGYSIANDFDGQVKDVREEDNCSDYQPEFKISLVSLIRSSPQKEGDAKSCHVGNDTNYANCQNQASRIRCVWILSRLTK